VVFALLTCLGAGLAVAQSTTSLHGIISDPKGAVLPGASVTILDRQTSFSRTVNSGPDGVYQFLQIPPATYSVTVKASGFADVTRERVTLLVSSPATLDFAVQVAGASVKVEVTSEAPLVNTQDASIGNAFDERQLLKLPSEGRDPVAILSLQPGVSFVGSNVAQSNDSRGGTVAGARSDQTNITLDGVDDNEQLNGFAFQGALRTTLDSIEEFRVTTSNGNADEGRSSGGQVSMVTKSGTNSFHGGVYEYNRTNVGQANDWFNKQAEVKQGLPNKPGQLIRNTFGATLGGPIQKDRMFFFTAYEGQRRREASQVTETVPSDLLRQGTIQYLCDPSSDPNCIANTTPATGVTVLPPNPNISGSDNIVQLSPGALAAIDPNCSGAGTCPLGPGPNPLVAFLAGNPNSSPTSIFNLYPHANSDAAGDLLDYTGFTFPGASPEKLNTYILKLDYKITANGNHTLFVRGNLQNDNESLAPEFPGQPASAFNTPNNKGIAAGYTALLRPNLINNFRWALVREGQGFQGANSVPYIHFRTLNDLTALGSQSEFFNLPVYNFVDDVTWTKGKHTLQFGTNLRILHNNRKGNLQNLSTGVTDPFALPTATVAGSGSSLDPGVVDSNNVRIEPNYPLVDPAFGELYDFAVMGLAGVESVENAVFNQDTHGNVVPSGALISRHFKSAEGEWYAQDAWRVKPNLTITAGVRYSLLQPPYEANGIQAAPTISIGNLFAERAKLQLSGQSFSPGQNAANGLSGGLAPITFAPSGQANGKSPYWQWDYRNLAPRFALAYSPQFDSGLLHRFFGSAGKSSLRLGYGLYYDHFGQGLVDTFDREGSFGLTTTESNTLAVQTVDCADRYSGEFNLPQGVFCGQQMNGVAPGPFPVTPPVGVNQPGGFAITWGMDDRLKTPYSHVFNFSFTRDLGHNFVLETSYIGRLGRHLLQETDVAMPQDIVDPKTHQDYFSAATTLSKLARDNSNAPPNTSGTPVSQVTTANAGTYWEDLFPALGQFPTEGGLIPQSQLFGCTGGPDLSSLPAGDTTVTQAMYDTFACNVGDEVVALQDTDTPTFGACFPLCSTLPGQTAASAYNFFMPQFSSLWAWRTSGNSSYHALNVTLRHALSKGIQFDVNYTYSKSIDVGSNAERVNLFAAGPIASQQGAVGGFTSQVINSWAPNSLRAVSDFDTTHQLNSNWVIDLPVGRGRTFGTGMGRLADAILGGWSLSGLFHWSSGLPFSILAGGGWATNYDLEGQAIEIGNPGKVGVYPDAAGNREMFPNQQSALAVFRHPFPGESGQRNNLRGPGYFGIDAGLDKDWKIREGQTLSFNWEAFNITNAVRFDAANSGLNFDTSSVTAFGIYDSTLTVPRVMQFMVRYSF
jgi:hypothetical protein